MNKNALIIAAIIIVAGGAFFFLSNRAEAPIEGQVTSKTPDTSSKEIDDVIGDIIVSGEESVPTVIITYTDDGFDPKSVVITRGDTVRFLNESSARMWIGADIHPTHSLYPEKSEGDCLGSSFDQCTANQNGEFWEFTFNATGTYGYHNHVRASKRGTIIVE